MAFRRLIIVFMWTGMLLVTMCIAAYYNSSTAKATTGHVDVYNNRSDLQANPLTLRFLKSTPTPTPRRLPRELAWNPGGGAAPTCTMIPPRVSEPTVIEDWEASTRTLQECLYGFPENADILITAVNSKGEVFTKHFTGGAAVTSSDQQGEYEVTVTEINLLWPNNAPGGEWTISLTWADFKYNSTIKVDATGASNHSSNLVHTPIDFRDPLRVSFPGTPVCYLEYAYHPGDSTIFSGSGYPTNTDIDMGLYRQPDFSGMEPGNAVRVSSWVVQTDNQGNFNFRFQIPGDSAPGMYWIVAPTDIEPLLGNPGTRCFMVEGAVSQEPTATPQATETPRPTNATVLQNSYLRAGPGIRYARVGTLRAGARITIVGSNAEGDWYQLDSGEWIAAFLVRRTAGPTPTPPVPTHTPTPQAIFLRPTCGLMIRMAADAPITLYYGILANRGFERATRNEANIQVALTIDGQAISGQRILPPTDTIEAICRRDYESSYWIYNIANVTLPPGRHRVQVAYHFLQPVNDGYGNNYTGSFTQNYTLVAK